MSKILLVEDNKSIALLTRKKIEEETDFDVTWASTFWEAIKIINSERAPFVAALLDLNLPDAPDGQIVDFAISKNIPSIVFSGEYSDEIRENSGRKKLSIISLKKDGKTLIISSLSLDDYIKM